jgi:hypothetical protein
VRALGTLNGDPISVATNGVRATVGGGITIFSDLVHFGVARPIDHPAKWQFVIGIGPAF